MTVILWAAKVEFNAYFLILKIFSKIKNSFSNIRMHFLTLEIQFLILEMIF